MSTTIAERIRNIRLAAGESPATMGGKLGVSRQAVVKWEGGDTKNMKLHNLVKFCDTYHVDVDTLIRGESSQHRVEETRAPYSALQPVHLTPVHRELLAGFDAASAETKENLLLMARAALARFEPRRETN